MKAARRHELKENELANQLVAVGDVLRQHGLTIGLGVVVILGAILGTNFYISNQANQIDEAWTRLVTISSDRNAELADRVDRFARLADENVSPALSITALKSGIAASIEAAATASAAGKQTDAQRWRERTKELCDKLKRGHGSDLLAVAAADFGLAAIAEQEGQYVEARKMYEAIKTGSIYAKTAFVDEAEFRLTGLDKWKEPVQFAPPLAPDPSAGSPMMNMPGMSGSTKVAPTGADSDGAGSVAPTAKTPTDMSAATPEDAPADAPSEPDAPPAEEPSDTPSEPQP